MVKLIWITPDAENLIVYIARVSNPQSQVDGLNPERLIRYLINHKHWSPLEMASACIEINTTRDIGRQLLRHRSFSFQEFSFRYQTVEKLPEVGFREVRLQDKTNRQNSIETEDHNLQCDWIKQQSDVLKAAQEAYKWALGNDIAKEVARAVLPEGLTPSRLYMAGSIRSWYHYCQVRHRVETQKEHRNIAKEVTSVLAKELPNIFSG